MISSILLAAGLSSRMGGENKLSKKINGLPLVSHAIKNILGSAVNEIIVVLGHEKDIIKDIIQNNKKIKFCYNKNYKNGISSSIKVGLNNISKKTDAFFICLGDMPDVSQSIYNKLIKTRYNYNKKLKIEHKKEIIIPTYEGRSGNPVLFSKFIKQQIMNISGDEGAKKIIDLNKSKTLYVPLKSDGINLDFDTQEDFSE